jgi:hypothetical protein
MVNIPLKVTVCLSVQGQVPPALAGSALVSGRCGRPRLSGKAIRFLRAAPSREAAPLAACAGQARAVGWPFLVHRASRARQREETMNSQFIRAIAAYAQLISAIAQLILSVKLLR